MYLFTGEAPSFSESHSRWAQPYRVGIVAMGIRLLFKSVIHHAHFTLHYITNFLTWPK